MENNLSSMGIDYLYGNDGVLVIGDNCSINTNMQYWCIRWTNSDW